MNQRELYSQEAEQSVLGAIMLDDSLIDDVACILETDDFYMPDHQRIFSAMIAMAGKPIDAITISEEVDRTAQLGDLKSLDYIVQIIQSTPSTANVKSYARIVKERKTERDLFSCGQKMQSLCLDTELSHQERLERSQIAFTALSSERQASTQVSVKDSLKTVLGSLDRRFNGQDDGRQIKTGLSDIDERIQGFREGDLVLVGARPSMGKTTYMTNIAKHVARYHGKVMIFSLEMTHESLTQRLIACCGKVDMGMLRDPKSSNRDPGFWPKVSTSVQVIKELPIIIDDQGGLSLPQVCSRARREHRQSPIKMIMVDYIQKMNDGDRKNASNKNLEIGNISSGLKNLAKELGCPVVALSQLNRGLESRTDKRPNNSDLRDSGNLEQDADVIQFLYRDEIYDEDSPVKGVIEVITSKFRDGETGTDRLSFEGKYNLIADLDAAMFAQQQSEHESQGKKTKFQY